MRSPAHLSALAEFVAGGTLASLRASFPAQRLPLSLARPLMWQLFEGLAELHAAGYMHRDLKEDNLLLRPLVADPWRPGRDLGASADNALAADGGGPAYELVITDLGSCGGRVIRADGLPGALTSSFLAGSLPYMPPEMLAIAAGELSGRLSTASYNETMDVWSAAALYAELLSGRALCAESGSWTLEHLRARYARLARRPELSRMLAAEEPFKQHVPDGVRAFLLQCLVLQPQRPTAAAALEHAHWRQ